MKLDSFICLNNNHLKPLIKGLFEYPHLAIFQLERFEEFQKKWSDYQKNHLLCLITGNPELSQKEEESLLFIANAYKQASNIIPIIITPYQFEKGVDLTKAQSLLAQYLGSFPQVYLLNLNATLNNQQLSQLTLEANYDYLRQTLKTLFNKEE